MVFIIGSFRFCQICYNVRINKEVHEMLCMYILTYVSTTLTKEIS